MKSASESDPSDPLKIIGELSRQESLAGLLVGGYAVNFHGYSRMTNDIDFVIRRSDLTQWKTAVATLGYRSESEGENFVQMGCSKGFPRLDLMLVNEETFAKLSSRALASEHNIPVVCAEHLIALKLHALSQGLEHRQIKDFLDVVEIIASRQIDLHSDEMREIFERYASPDLTRRIRIACEQDEDCQ